MLAADPNPDAGAPRPAGRFAALGRFVYVRRVLVLILTGVFVLGAAVAGLSVFDRLRSGGFEDPDAESSRAAVVLDQQFGAAAPGLVFVLAGGPGVDDPAVGTAAQELEAEIRSADGVEATVSYWSSANPGLRSEDGASGLLMVSLDGDDEQASARAAPIIERYEDGYEGLDVRVGGTVAINRAFDETIGADLARAEAIAVPISLVLLVIVFAGVVAALIPLLVAGIAVIGTFLALYLISLFADVSIFSINLATALGLGLAIDYALLMVSRFREQLRTGQNTEEAIATTMHTAGRTVAFSALIVSVSLGALLVFPMFFLRSFAYAGIAVVLIASLGALFSLPSLLSVLGPRIDRWALRRRRPSRSRASAEGFWARLARTVMRRPLVIGIPVSVLLVLLAAPFLGVEWGSPDERALPADDPARQVTEAIRADFPGGAATAGTVVLPKGEEADADRLAVAISGLDGVSAVDTLSGTYTDGALLAPPGPAAARYAADNGVYLSVSNDLAPVSAEAGALIAEIRSLPVDTAMLVGGVAAQLVDTKDAIFSIVPLALAIIALTTFVLLFLMTGSLLIPLKAIVLNILSLGATFGAMVWVFQEGNGSELLNFTETGVLDTAIPILMFCIAFGLSMDYEVFLLSRIKEAYDATGDTTSAVASGLQRSGRIMAAAAAVLAVSFIAFATSGVTFIKLLGIGLTLAVLLDATLVRALLVPAFMRLAGRANWWAPSALQRLHARAGLTES